MVRSNTVPWALALSFTVLTSIFTTGCNQQDVFVAVPKAPSAAGIPVAGPGDAGGGGGGNNGGGGSVTPTPSPAPIATSTPCAVRNITQNLGIMFMVDNSGSTLDTDPAGADSAPTYRSKTITEFIKNYGSKANFTYSFGYFQRSSAWIYIPGSSPSSGSFSSSATTVSSKFAFGSADDLSNALLMYNGITPADSTPYKAAFSMLENAINADAGSAINRNYAVVFMSDGEPKDVSSPIEANLRSMVVDLIAAAQANGRNLSLSTVYFGPENNATAISYLNAMASEGNGHFVDTNQTVNLVIDDVINVVDPNCAQ